MIAPLPARCHSHIGLLAGAAFLAAIPAAHADPLTADEMAALSKRLSGCWSIPTLEGHSAAGLKVTVQFHLDRSGAVIGRPEVVSPIGGSRFERLFAESAQRAILKCAPFSLPADRYDAWATITVNFDPAQEMP